MADPVPLPDPVPNPPAPRPDPYPGTPWYYWKRWVPTNYQSILMTVLLAAAGWVAAYFGVKNPLPPAPPVPPPIWYEGEMGWHEPDEAEKAQALAAPNVFQFSDTEAGKAANVFGDDDGNAFLWKIVAKSRSGPIPTLNQLGVGSCVGHGWATGVNYAICVQAALKTGPPIDPEVTIAPEVIYGGSRVNANGGRSPILTDGSNGSWAARFVTQTGVAARGKYGPYDISSYSESNCRTLGRKGIQGELLEECKKNVVGSTALIASAADAEKAIKQGYPIAICSNVGFAGQGSRDSDGFLQARGTWNHCMVVIGFRGDKKAFYIMNSWGEDWVKGPTGPGEPPPGGFWAKWETVERIMSQGDSYAISNVRGFPRQKIRPEDWIVKKQLPALRGEMTLAHNFGGSSYANAR